MATERMSKEDYKEMCDARRQAGLIVFGWPRERNTEIKDAGGVFDRVRRAWLIPEEALDLLELEWKKTKAGKDYLVPLGHVPKRLRENGDG